MGFLRNRNGGAGGGAGGAPGGDWVDNALQLASQNLGIPTAPPLPGGAPTSPATPGAGGNPAPTSGWGSLIYRLAQARAARGMPTPLADRMGWNLGVAAPKVPDTGVMPDRPQDMIGGGGLAQLLGAGFGPSQWMPLK